VKRMSNFGWKDDFWQLLGGAIYVLAQNKYRYLTYERSVKQLAASRFGNAVLESQRLLRTIPKRTPIYTSYFSQHLRFPYMKGWDSEKSVLRSRSELPFQENPEAVRKACLDWKRQIKTKIPRRAWPQSLCGLASPILPRRHAACAKSSARRHNSGAADRRTAWE
jgi:hypothetical protein